MLNPPSVCFHLFIRMRWKECYSFLLQLLFRPFKKHTESTDEYAMLRKFFHIISMEWSKYGNYMETSGFQAASRRFFHIISMEWSKCGNYMETSGFQAASRRFFHIISTEWSKCGNYMETSGFQAASRKKNASRRFSSPKGIPSYHRIQFTRTCDYAIVAT